MKATKITIVDDHHLVAYCIRDLLIKFGENNGRNFKILHLFENGLSLIESLRRDECPDLILLDLNMPIMDGYEAATIVKREFPSIKILVLTMDDRYEQVKRMKDIGVNGYIIKDCRPDELLMTIDKIIAGEEGFLVHNRKDYLDF